MVWAETNPCLIFGMENNPLVGGGMIDGLNMQEIQQPDVDLLFASRLMFSLSAARDNDIYTKFKGDDGRC